MTEQAKPVSAEDTLKQLEALKVKYLEKAGKTNYNPHVVIAKSITPLVDAITKSKTVTTEQVTAISKLPAECPVIDPNYKEPEKPKIIIPAAR